MLFISFFFQSLLFITTCQEFYMVSSFIEVASVTDFCIFLPESHFSQFTSFCCHTKSISMIRKMTLGGVWQWSKFAVNYVCLLYSKIPEQIWIIWILRKSKQQAKRTLYPNLEIVKAISSMYPLKGSNASNKQCCSTLCYVVNVQGGNRITHVMLSMFQAVTASLMPCCLCSRQ